MINGSGYKRGSPHIIEEVYTYLSVFLRTDESPKSLITPLLYMTPTVSLHGWDSSDGFFTKLSANLDLFWYFLNQAGLYYYPNLTHFNNFTVLCIGIILSLIHIAVKLEKHKFENLMSLSHSIIPYLEQSSIPKILYFLHFNNSLYIPYILSFTHADILATSLPDPGVIL